MCAGAGQALLRRTLWVDIKNLTKSAFFLFFIIAQARTAVKAEYEKSGIIAQNWKIVLSKAIKYCILSVWYNSADSGPLSKEVIALDDTKTRILFAAMKAVRRYGLEGVRIQNVSQLAGISPGALYRHFDSKEQLIVECFTYVDRQAAAIFERLELDPRSMLADPMGAVKSLWLPYFRFWTAHPDETVFYHRFRDSAFFPKYDKSRDIAYFDTFIGMVRLFKETFPALERINQDLLWLHVLTSTVMYAKYVVEGVLPNTRETEDTVFQLLASGLSGYLTQERQTRSGGGIPGGSK